MSLMSMEKSRGRRTEPWRTIDVMGRAADKALSVYTQWLRSLRYEIIRLTTLVVNPNWSDNLEHSRWWLTLSNALGKSSNTKRDTNLSSVAIYKSFVIFNRARKALSIKNALLCRFVIILMALESAGSTLMGL
jgi:hypothetical protein